MSDILHYTSNKGICLAIKHDDFELQEVSFISKNNIQKKWLASNLITDWLDQYFNQKRPKQKLKWQLNGTDFQISVWQTIASIPFGQTMTYQDIAIKIKKPKACRAVGTACGANPIPLFIPCHRVLSKTGLGGFSDDIEVKKILLTHEGVSF